MLDISTPEGVSAYDESPLWSAAFGLLLFDYVPLTPRSVALDVGCGTGFPAIDLAERLGQGSHVHGVDVWSGALKRAREKAALRGVRNATFHDCDAADMPFADATFDLIVSNLGANNFADRARALRECRRVLKPGGVLALTSNIRGHMRELYAAFRDVLHDRADTEALAALDAQEATRTTVADLEALLSGCGFTVTRTEQRTLKARFSAAKALFDHSFTKLAFLEGWQRVLPAERRAEVFSELETRLDRNAGAGALELTIPMVYIEAR